MGKLWAESKSEEYPVRDMTDAYTLAKERNSEGVFLNNRPTILTPSYNPSKRYSKHNWYQGSTDGGYDGIRRGHDRPTECIDYDDALAQVAGAKVMNRVFDETAASELAVVSVENYESVNLFGTIGDLKLRTYAGFITRKLDRDGISLGDRLRTGSTNPSWYSLAKSEATNWQKRLPFADMGAIKKELAEYLHKPIDRQYLAHLAMANPIEFYKIMLSLKDFESLAYAQIQDFQTSTHTAHPENKNIREMLKAMNEIFELNVHSMDKTELERFCDKANHIKFDFSGLEPYVDLYLNDHRKKGQLREGETADGCMKEAQERLTTGVKTQIETMKSIIQKSGVLGK